MTDFRALCAELLDALDSGIPTGRICMSPLANRARAALAEQSFWWDDSATWLRQRDMRVIADCQATKEWPGYGDTCQALSLPSWALRNDTAITSEDF